MVSIPDDSPGYMVFRLVFFQNGHQLLSCPETDERSDFFRHALSDRIFFSAFHGIFANFILLEKKSLKLLRSSIVSSR
jgi:hypothetical protein